jgi:hypothetical protein
MSGMLTVRLLVLGYSMSANRQMSTVFPSLPFCSLTSGLLSIQLKCVQTALYTVKKALAIFPFPAGMSLTGMFGY